VRLTQTKAELRAASAVRRRAVVMTMGALHAGHAALLREARERVGPDGSVVLTIFVNPLQFGPAEDFDTYPRTLAADLAVAKAEGVDLVFNPSRDELYPQEPTVTIHPGPLADELEGKSRPGHFGGVLTVVSKMLHLTAPDLALFGEKDYQQLTLIRAMVTDAKAGAHGPDAVLEAAHAELDEAPGIDLDYFALRAPDLGPVVAPGEARMLVAARVGQTRLIDNLSVTLR
jgi:pantoate--beta-alanine ligase